MLLAGSRTLSSSGPNSCLRFQETRRQWESQEATLFLTELSGSCLPEGPAGLSPRLPGTRRPPSFPARPLSASSGVRFPEATDLLGAQRLSGYAGGARLMAAVRGAAAKTKTLYVNHRCAEFGGQPEPPRGPAEHHTAGAQLALPRFGPACPGPGAAQPGAPSSPHASPTRSSPRPRLQPQPPADRPPDKPGTAQRVRAGVLACVFPRAAAGGAGVRGVGTPARHLPSSLSSTIISGAPCPAAARLGREKGAGSGRASAGRPVLGQLAGSNYPLALLLT